MSDDIPDPAEPETDQERRHRHRARDQRETAVTLGGDRDRARLGEENGWAERWASMPYTTKKFIADLKDKDIENMQAWLDLMRAKDGVVQIEQGVELAQNFRTANKFAKAAILLIGMIAGAIVAVGGAWKYLSGLGKT